MNSKGESESSFYDNAKTAGTRAAVLFTQKPIIYYRGFSFLFKG